MAADPIKFDGIIIDPDLDARMRLRQICASVVQFGKVFAVNTALEAMSRLKGEESCHVVFIAPRLSQGEAADFIKEAKTTPQGQDSAYILVLANKNSDGASVAQGVMIGADGVVFEPYSVEQLVETTQIAAKVRKERSQTREEAALKFLINDMMHHIDLIAYSRSCGYDVGPTLKHFKQCCSVLDTLSPESMQIYLRLVVDLFEGAPLPTGLAQRKKYAGASSRVKKKMADKIAAEAEKIGNDQKPAS